MPTWRAVKKDGGGGGGGGGENETNKKRCFPCLSTCVVLPCNSGTPLCVSLVVCSIDNRLLMWSYQWLLNKVPNLLALIIMIRMLPMLFCMFYGSYFCNLQTPAIPWKVKEGFPPCIFASMAESRYSLPTLNTLTPLWLHVVDWAGMRAGDSPSSQSLGPLFTLASWMTPLCSAAQEHTPDWRSGSWCVHV